MRHQVNETLIMPGYAIDAEALVRIDEVVKQMLPQDQNPETLVVNASVGTSRNLTRIEGLGKLLHHLETELNQVKRLALAYQNKDLEVGLTLLSDGKIIITASSSTPLDLHMDRLKAELRRYDQEYSSFARAIVFPGWVRVAMNCLLAGGFAFFVLNGIAYLNALNVGVDFDSTVVPKGNAYLQYVERAIKSGSIEDKLNALLQAQLRNAVPVSTYLDEKSSRLIMSLVAIGFGVLYLFAQRLLKPLYPMSYFAFGAQKGQLHRMQRQRDIWMISVILGLAINLVAGVILSLIN